MAKGATISALEDMVVEEIHRLLGRAAPVIAMVNMSKKFKQVSRMTIENVAEEFHALSLITASIKLPPKKAIPGHFAFLGVAPLTGWIPHDGGFINLISGAYRSNRKTPNDLNHRRPGETPTNPQDARIEDAHYRLVPLLHELYQHCLESKSFLSVICATIAPYNRDGTVNPTASDTVARYDAAVLTMCLLIVLIIGEAEKVAKHDLCADSEAQRKSIIDDMFSALLKKAPIRLNPFIHNGSDIIRGLLWCTAKMMSILEHCEYAYELCVHTVGCTFPHLPDLYTTISDCLDPGPGKGRCIILFPGIVLANGSDYAYDAFIGYSCTDQ